MDRTSTAGRQTHEATGATDESTTAVMAATDISVVDMGLGMGMAFAMDVGASQQTGIAGAGVKQWDGTGVVVF